MNSKDISLAIIFASLYAVLVYVFASISFYTLQFRIAGVLRPAIAKKWILALGYAVGIVLGNLFSPFVGIYELLFMPTVGLIAGLLGYILAKKLGGSYFTSGVIIATVIPIGLSWMFNQLFGLPILITLLYTFISEQTICFIGACIFSAIEIRYVWW
jgi:uncharacterized membrane protein